MSCRATTGVSVVLLTSGKPAVAGLKSAMVADNT